MDKNAALKARKKTKSKKPGFQRQEGRLKKLKDGWRRPKGRHSKLRKKEAARGKHPSPGYGSPKSVRGLSKQGLVEVRVRNLEDLSGVQKKGHIVVISGTVGKKKRIDIIKKAEELGLKVQNPVF